MAERACERCGKAYEPTRRGAKQLRAGQVQRFCSQLCGCLARAGRPFDPDKPDVARGPAIRLPRPCSVCGLDFTPEKHAGRLICSPVCQAERDKADQLVELARRRARTAERYRTFKREVACKTCGTAFLTKAADRLFCSMPCKAAARTARSCRVCSAPLGPRMAVHCSAICRLATRKAMSDERLRRSAALLLLRPKTARTCIECSIGFEDFAELTHRLYCSDRCSTRAAGRRHPKEPRQRARKFGVAYEPVNRLIVFDRDNWRCQICGIKTPRKLLGKMNDRAPELDHRTPISRGGPHTYENCQCSCRGCNMKKGARRSTGQLPLFANPTEFSIG